MTTDGTRDDTDDLALVSRIAGGDRDALDELYRVHAGWLTARLQRRCSDTELVDSAVQDTFLAVWRGARRYDRSGAVGAWIWGIGARRLIDQMRRRKPAPSDLTTGAMPCDSAEDQALAAGLQGDLGDAFARLDPDLRNALIATTVDGLSTREAAILLGVPQGTIKTRLSRARARLREELT